MSHSFHKQINSMKKWLLLTLLVTLFSVTLKADLGSCVVYHAKFYLKNGAVFNGCFEFTGYFEGTYLNEQNTNRFCNDKGVFELFKKQQIETGKVKVYKTLHYLHPRPLRKRRGEALPNYGFVLQEDKVTLDSSSILKLKFRRAEYSKREWLMSEIIVGTAGMLDTIRHHRYWNRVIASTENWETEGFMFKQHQYIDGPYGGFALYNYNPQVNIAEMKRLVRLKLPLDQAALTEKFKRKHRLKDDQFWTREMQLLYNEEFAQKMQDIKRWFWAKGILMVTIQGTC